MEMESNLLTDLLDKALECPVCLEQLDATAKVLPCQHYFCRRCLDEIVHSRRELLCPECRVQCFTKVEELPSNILLIRLLEGIRNRNRISDVSHVTDLLSLVPQSAGQTPPPPAGNVSSAQLMFSQQLSQQQLSSCNQNAINSPNQSIAKQIASLSSANSPRAKALYNYDGKEHEGDLSFKKGDIIILRKRIDPNWFYGELNGKSGFLPSSYVQVLVAPPSPLPPQCKALYDFRVTDVEDKDCLSFSKGDIITVTRRVDENWAEGKLMDRIGIFPISFVEMNTSARAIMKLALINTNMPSRCPPPAPIISSEATTSTNSISQSTLQQTSTSIETHSHSQSSNISSNSPSTLLPNIQSSNSPLNCSYNASSFMPSVTSIMPVTVSGPVLQNASLMTLSSASFQSPMPSTSPSLAQQNSNDNRVNNKDDNANHKRHSLCSVPSQSPNELSYQRSQSYAVDMSQNQTQTQPQCRRSLEILNNFNEGEGVWTTEFARTAVIRNSFRRSDESGEFVNRNSSPFVESSNAQTLFYVAMYNYKPQKSDELELKKGELYTVSEKCHDGWYKGVSVSGASGVFPGNYVQIAKTPLPVSAQFQSANTSTVQELPTVAKTIFESSQALPVREPPLPKPKPVIQPKPNITLSSNETNISCQQITADKSKASISYARPRPSGQSLLDGSRSINSLVPPPPPPQKPSRALNSNIPVAKVPREDSPITQLAAAMNESLFNSKSQSSSQSSLSQSSWHQPKVAATRNSTAFHSASAAITPPPNVSVTSQQSNVSNVAFKPPVDKKEKQKEKSSFMKRLTSAKPKRKPQNTTQQPNSNNARNAHNSGFSCDNPTFVDSSSHLLSPIHVRSGSCPNESLNDFTIQRKQSSVDDLSNTVIRNTNATKTTPKEQQPIAPLLVRERFKCVVPYPPNSEYELELQVGDIVYVHKKRDDGWFKGTLQRTGKTGLFPGPFVESF